MLFDRRHFQYVWAKSLGDLVQDLTERSWTLCQAFRFGPLYLLNDSISENSAQEWAVVLKDGRQIESLTASWMKYPELEKELRKLQRQVWEGRFTVYSRISLDQVQTSSEHGTCQACA